MAMAITKIYHKVGLLILNSDRTKFLVCQKYRRNVTDAYIMPGGQNDEQDDIECLKNEIAEELSCELDIPSLKYIGNYRDIAAGFSDRNVEIKLYEGKIIGEPVASTEVEKVHWIGFSDMQNKNVSSIIRTKIMPDILDRQILIPDTADISLDI